MARGDRCHSAQGKSRDQDVGKHKQLLSSPANCCARGDGIHLVPEQSSRRQRASNQPPGRISPSNGGSGYENHGEIDRGGWERSTLGKTLLRPWGYTMGVFVEGRENSPVS